MEYLAHYGYDEGWTQSLHALGGGLAPARVTAQHRTQYLLAGEDGEVSGQVSGKYRFQLDARGGYPAVGDFVAGRMSGGEMVIEHILPRRTFFARWDGFHGASQALAANVDSVLLCMSLNHNFNIQRLSRYLILSRKSGAQPVVTLTKTDLCEDPEPYARLCRELDAQAPVVAISAASGQGMELLAPYIAPGKTVAALGSSGVGKSTLLNALCGLEVMATADVRQGDDHGRHKTVHRQIIRLPGGGLFLDTPGMRELALDDAQEAVTDLYEDVAELVEACRFRDCRHQSEPGCAVRAAVAAGAVTKARVDAYLRYLREARPHRDSASAARLAYEERIKTAKKFARYSRQLKQD